MSNPLPPQPPPPPPITLSAEQESILSSIKKWFLDSASPALTLGGYAGTGKTTILRQLVDSLTLSGHSIAVASFTGKAVHVLRSKGLTQSQTLHSFLYNATRNKDGTFTFTFKGPPAFKNTDLLIVDEASMVSTDLHRDLLRTGVRTLFVGDHGQLEPVGENPRLMDLPDLRLETIHRQALDSPILRFAHDVRSGSTPLYQSSPPFLEVCRQSAARFTPSFQILTAFNEDRVQINRKVRSIASRSPLPEVGDRIIFLRNNPAWSIFNGMMATLTSITYSPRSPSVPIIEALCDDTITRGPLPLHPFSFNVPKGELPRPPYHPDFKGHEFCLADYGYAITVHKAQGSEFPSVVVLERPSRLWSLPRWRYTAATRASQSLVYVTESGITPSP